jgi:hypothetical protein
LTTQHKHKQERLGSVLFINRSFFFFRSKPIEATNNAWERKEFHKKGNFSLSEQLRKSQFAMMKIQEFFDKWIIRSKHIATI